MPALAQHHSTDVIKLLVIGDSSCGKTGGLAALAAAGYKLRILDFDNGMDVLHHWLTHPKSKYLEQNPKALDNVHYITLTDTMKTLPDGKMYRAASKAWPKATAMLQHWKEGDIDLGKVTTWGPDTILVIDSLTMATIAALTYHLSMNGKLTATPTQNEGRRNIGEAQNYIRDLLTLLYDKEIKCNVLVTSHITYVTDQGGAPKPDEPGTGMPIGYPSSIGRALSPHIPRFFNNMLIMRSEGAGQMIRRKIYTTPQVVGGQMISAKVSVPLSVPTSFPIETGLADFFKIVRGEPPK